MPAAGKLSPRVGVYENAPRAQPAGNFGRRQMAPPMRWVFVHYWCRGGGAGDGAAAAAISPISCGIDQFNVNNEVNYRRSMEE